VRLLLDEHLPSAIAERLRQPGHDVEAVTERRDLRGLDDAKLLSVAAEERRVLVSQDVVDLMLLGAQRISPDRQHHGIVLVSRAAYPLSAQAIGRIVRTLDRLVVSYPRDDALVGQVVWLPG
jgi:uncharacterized protein DUF5615